MKLRAECWMTIALSVFVVQATFADEPGANLRFGSKKFTESVILGELLAASAKASGAQATHRRELGGTQVVWGALVRGDIDAYVEYTGTIREEILANEDLGSDEDFAPHLEAKGIRVSRPVGFNNTYALGMTRAGASKWGVAKISDLTAHPDLRFGLTSEFLDRGDGWPALRAHYRLPHQDVRGLDHDLAYRGLTSGALDVMDLYSTDAEIRYYDLVVLDDDRAYFPRYDAVILYRADLVERFPEVLEDLLRLEGAISSEKMIAMNARAKIDRVSESQVAADFLREEFAQEVEVVEQSVWDRLRKHGAEHLTLVGVSLAAAIACAVPLGIWSARRVRWGQAVLGMAGIVQTIPSLAILVFLIPLLGIGAKPAVVALFLYSLLPIVRNTVSGLQGIAPELRESADALGLTARAKLFTVELPLASRSILAGIKTAAVINVGTATLAALVGAGGYGQPIFTGIRLDDSSLILQGAIPAAALALAVQGIFEWAERFLVPEGLRLKPAR